MYKELLRKSSLYFLLQQSNSYQLSWKEMYINNKKVTVKISNLFIMIVLL